MLLVPSAIDIGGRSLRYARVEGAGPAFVLLHGYPDSLQVWSALAPRLGACLAFDWPGLGYSEPWTGGAGPDALADRLEHVLDAFGIERAVLVAHDMGAPPALVLAARRPERVEAVVAMNALLFGDAGTGPEIAVMRRFELYRAAMGFPETVFRRCERTFVPAALDERLRHDMLDAFRRLEVRRFVVRMCAAYEAALPGLPGVWEGIRAPVLALWGESDHHFAPEHGRRLAALVPGGRFESVPGGWHWMALHAPDATAASIRRFALR
jgi:pimeloyl-ACP methyl ester carboxylesterase